MFTIITSSIVFLMAMTVCVLSFPQDKMRSILWGVISIINLFEIICELFIF